MAAWALPGTNLRRCRLEADWLFQRHGHSTYSSADAYRYSNGDHYFHTYSDRNSHTDADSISDSNAFTDAHGDANPNSYSYIYANADPDILNAKLACVVSDFSGLDFTDLFGQFGCHPNVVPQ